MRHRKRTFKYPGDWVEEAACGGADVNQFFPPDDKPVPRNFYMKAKRTYCLSCPVTRQCAEFGEDEQYGVWGATTPVERDRQRKQRPI